MGRLIKILLSLALTCQDFQMSAVSEMISGREFWVVTPDTKNGCPECMIICSDSIFLYIMGDTACTGYLENTFLNYHLDFSVVPNIPTVLTIPASLTAHPLPIAGAQQAPYQPFETGVFIKTTHNVTVYTLDKPSKQNTLRDYSSYTLTNLNTSCRCEFLYTPVCILRTVPQDPLYQCKSVIWPIKYDTTTHLLLRTNFNSSYFDSCIITAMEDSVRLFIRKTLSGYSLTTVYDTIMLYHKGQSVMIDLVFYKDQLQTSYLLPANVSALR